MTFDLRLVVTASPKALYPLTFSSTPRDNVIMVRESLLSNMSPPCDERMLCEHVKHHTPKHLSVSVSSPGSPPITQDERGKGQTEERACSKKQHRRGNLSAC